MRSALPSSVSKTLCRRKRRFRSDASKSLLETTRFNCSRIAAGAGCSCWVIADTPRRRWRGSLKRASLEPPFVGNSEPGKSGVQRHAMPHDGFRSHRIEVSGRRGAGYGATGPPVPKHVVYCKLLSPRAATELLSESPERGRRPKTRNH